MKLVCSLVIAAQVLLVLALPAPNKAGGAATASATTTAAAVATTSAAAEAGTGGEAGEGEENEIVQQGQFGQVIQLGGGNIKTDTEFPPGVSPPSPHAACAH